MGEPEEISRVNQNFGISRWNGYHLCYHCCYCDLECPVTLRERTYLQREGAYRSEEFEEWQIALKKRAKEKFAKLVGEIGHHLDYRQVIHRECLSMMTPEERLKIQHLNPNNLPLPETKSLIAIQDYRLLRPDALCIRCDAALEATSKGYAFEQWREREKRTAYVHDRCLFIMSQYQSKKNF